MEIQQAMSKCILENLEQRLKAAEDHAKPSPSQPSPPNRQQQTAVERSEQAAPLFCQVSEGGMGWDGGGKSMGSSCNLPLPPSWDTNPVPTSRTPILPTWDELEPVTSFTCEAVHQEDTQQPTTIKHRLKREL